MSDAGQETNELPRQRLIETEVLAYELDGFRRRIHAGREARRIAGEQMNKEKDEQRDDQQRRQDAQQPLDDVLQHGASPRPAAASRRYFKSTS